MAKRFIAGSDGQHDAGAGEFALIFPFLPVLRDVGRLPENSDS